MTDTTQPPTPAELAAWGKLCEKATAGPWDEKVTAAVLLNGLPCWDSNIRSPESRGDAAFIAAARDALPRLLDEVERLREENAAQAAETERLKLAFCWLRREDRHRPCEGCDIFHCPAYRGHDVATLRDIPPVCACGDHRDPETCPDRDAGCEAGIAKLREEVEP